jgi:hypothetical protein
VAQLLDHLPVHLELGIKRKKTLQLVQHLAAHGRSENLRTLGSLLWGEQAYPDALYLGTVAPEAEEFFEISRAAGDLASARAVYGHKTFADGVENAFVGGGFAALVMLRL